MNYISTNISPMYRSAISTLPKYVARRQRLLAPFLRRMNGKAVKQCVYVSYSHATDSGFKKFLEEWDTGTDFTFVFSRYPSGLGVTGAAMRPVKSAITHRMRRAQYLLVIVGEKTHLDEWVTWEVNRAQQPGVSLKVAAVRINALAQPPAGMPETSWADGFTKHSILSALEKAGGK